MSISQLQNMPENVDLLAAQRRLYSDAKRARLIRGIGSGIAAVPLPILAAFVPSAGPIVTAIGGVWLFVALGLMVGVERRNITNATRVIEEFDVNVFGIAWNERTAGARVIREVIARAVRRYRGDRSELQDWYPNVVDGLPWPLSVLACQKASVIWDWHLRRTYGWFLAFLSAGLLLGSVAAALALGYSVLNWLLLLMLPMASALVGGAGAAIVDLADSQEQREMHERLERDWRVVLETGQPIAIEHCRQHQDCRYAHRLKARPIPDWWYRTRRDAYEKDMQGAARRAVLEYSQRGAAQDLRHPC